MTKPPDPTKTRSKAVSFNTRRRLAIVAVIMPLVLSGCGGKAQQFFGRLRTPKTGLISKEELWQELDKAEEFGEQLLTETTEQLKEAKPDEKIRRVNLVRNVRVTQSINTMLGQEDPIIAFLELWGLAVRLTNYYKIGEGSTLYEEEHLNVVTPAAEQFEAELERIGRMFLKEEEFDATRKEIRRFAGQNPIRETFSNLVVYVTETRPGQPTPFGNIMAIPLSPFTAMQGMDRTAAAIHGVRGSMDEFTDVIGGLPESAKWQLMLLLMDAEDTNVVKTLMTSASTLSESSAKLVATAEQLPEELRNQVSVLLEDIDERQANIQATLEKTKETAVALEQNLVTATTTIEAAGQTAQTINETAGEWESAIEATNELVRFVEQWHSGMPKKDPNTPTTAQDYTETAQTVTEAAGELRILVAEARDLLESGVLSAQIEDVNGRADGLTDRVFWRLMQLAGIVFVLSLAYRFASVRVIAKERP